MNKLSLNNRLIIEPYVNTKGLKAKNDGGFAIVEQKVKIVGLKLLVDTKLTSGNSVEFLSKGSTVFIKEESLSTAQWAKKIYESEGIEGKFIIVDVKDVEFVTY